MLQLRCALRLLVAVSTSILAQASPHLHPRANCLGNTATTRSRWCDHSIDTDYTSEVPETGVTREYWLELTDVVVSPDGVSRSAMAVNGSIPGPTLFADWGDVVVVHVTNSLTTSNNGTSIHFHGIRQNFTNQNDGVVSITQCPTAVGQTVTYTWRATQYGSTWYHSHFALQSWQGIFGGIVINGPATANYDEDLGPLFLNDWSHATVDQQSTHSKTNLLPQFQDNGLINGTNVYGNRGRRLNIRFKPGASHRLRLINAAVETQFKFMIDSHSMTVIAADLVPIKPYKTTVLNIGIGQRYDVIVTADQARIASSFWLRAIPQALCSLNKNALNIQAIVHYGDDPSTPTTQGYDYLPLCDDETRNVVPHVPKTVAKPDEWTSELVGRTFTGKIFLWTLNSTSMSVSWTRPTLMKVLDPRSKYRANEAFIELANANIMFHLVIQTYLPVPHPIHLHGHDFFVLAQGYGVFDARNIKLATENPPRRDTAMLPALGYLVIGFETDNPGVWLLHCHIGFHVSEGFALQFIERPREISALVDRSSLEKGCAAWTSFQSAKSLEQHDSGV